MIDINKFGNTLFKNSSLVNEINEVSFGDFGPIGCSMITIYNLVLPNCSLRKQLISALQKKYT